MSGFDQDSAVAMIDQLRRIDAEAAIAAAEEPGADRTRIAKRTELRQALLAVVAAAIEDGLEPAQAVDVACGTGSLVMGSAVRLNEGGKVSRKTFASLASAVVDHLATSAGVGVTLVDRMPLESAARPTHAAPTHSDHQTRQ